ncbi:MAG: T9SS type A sorting domain-containing protein [Melioribacteraceae bacterium]|nr:T9SS type A sorting domain-containing protein [Melioribacteraceae bacterium]
MKLIANLIRVFIIMGSLSAHNFAQPSGTDTVNIFAVMVEFAEDKDDATFGNGKFGSIYSQEYGNSILDPLPHDRNYFDRHLEFAQNYFSKVSDGNLEVRFKVADEIFTVSKTMRNYSPEPRAEGFDELANFAAEVWDLVDVAGTGIDFSNYDLFLIFHAGVGREFSLAGSIGNERDLPSIYLSKKTFESALGNDFEGFQVGANNFRITNTLIMPETESREEEGFGEVNLLELSMNGLLVANIASHIGLPDLFNTSTGQTSIGRFGLMDPQSFFTYRGVIPPEPSAWEKYFLGWIEPLEINPPGQYQIELAAYETALANETSAIKIPINSTEYYLIENRKRDANKDGATISYYDGDVLKTTNFNGDVDGFQFYGVDSLKGVIVDVDEFDWALPGIESNDEDGDPFEDLGLLIWHIDEKVIESNISTNSINNGITKGVRLVEADGVQEIGEVFETIFGTQVAEGGKEDTWYLSNPAQRYNNILNADSFPNTNSNSGAKSFIEITNFSTVSDNMSFSVKFIDDNFRVVGLKTISTINPISNLTISNIALTQTILINSDSNSDLIGFTEFLNSGSSLTNFSSGRAASILVNSDQYLVGAAQNIIKIWDDAASNMVSLSLNSVITSDPLIYQRNQSTVVLVGAANGWVYEIDLLTQTISDSTKIFENLPIKHIVANESTILAASQNSLFAFGDIIDINSEIIKVVLIDDGIDSPKIIILDSNNTFSLIRSSGLEILKTITSTNSISNFIVSDILNNGSNYIVYTNGSALEAINLEGVLADNFPFKTSTESLLSPFILSADYQNDGTADLFIFDENGNGYIVNKQAEVIAGPYSLGSIPSINPVLYNSQAENRLSLAVVTDQNRLVNWNVNSTQNSISWQGYYKNSTNNNLINTVSVVNQISEFFPENKAYNWPNPVYENSTNFRFYVSEDSNVEIKIFDLAGTLVDELTGIGNGGYENEIVWNVSDIESGVYFAHLKVESNFGQSSFKNIKVAVVK